MLTSHHFIKPSLISLSILILFLPIFLTQDTFIAQANTLTFLFENEYNETTTMA